MGKLDGCANCAKILLIVFNIIFFIVGIALLAVGIWVVTSPYNLEMLAILDNAIIASGAYFIIALGAFIFVVSFLGCCGAWMENRLMLIIYFIVVLGIFIAQLIGCAVIIAYKEKVDTFVTERLEKTMNMYMNETSEDRFSVGWNAVQLVLECCGTNNHSDWMETYWYGNNTDITVGTQTFKPAYPATCCKVGDNLAIIEGNYPAPLNLSACYGLNGVSMATRDMWLNKDGCYLAFEEWVKNRALYIGGVGLGLAFLEVFSMVFAICVCRGVGKDD